jgi:hypothetical protein
MSDSLEVLIDLNKAGLELESDELESFIVNLANEMQDGLADSAAPARAEDLPEGAKSAGAGFDLGFLKAEVNFQNLQLLMNWLGERIYGRTITIEYGDVKLEYRTEKDLEHQLEALDKIAQLRVRVIDASSD